MALSHESVIYDVHDFKVYPLISDTGASPSYGAAVDVFGIAEVSLEPNFVTAELKGDAKVIAKKGRVDRFNVSATYGKLSMDVLEVLLGGSTQDTGETSAAYTLGGANSLPYFKAAFKISDLDVGLGDCHVTVYKCQLTGGTLISGSSDEFAQPELELEGIPCDSDDSLVKIEFLSTLTDLPA